MQANTLNLALVAHFARDALEAYTSDNSDVTFNRFPRGACGATSDLIGRYLHEAYQLRPQLVSGRRQDGAVHIWLSVCGIIIDITADQFGKPAVIVTRESAWHETWETGTGEPPHVHQNDWLPHLAPAWNALVASMVQAKFRAPGGPATAVV